MKNMLRDIWIWDRRGFMTILLLNIAVSLTGGISIVMLVPMLGFLNVSEGAASALSMLILPLQNFSETVQLVIIIGAYLFLIVLKAYLGWLIKIRQSEFLEAYSLALREKLYHTVSRAKWEQLAAGKQTDTIDLFTAQCTQVSQGVSMIITLMSSVVSALVSLMIAIWLSLPVTVFVLTIGSAFAMMFRRLMKASKQYGDEMIQISRAMYSELFSQLRSVKEVRSYGVQKEHAALFGEISRSFKDAKLKYTRRQALPSMLYSIAAAAMIAVIFVFSVLAFRMDTARLMVLVYVFTRLWPVFSGFINKLTVIQTTIPAYKKLTEAFQTLSMEETSGDDTAFLSFEKQIEFRNVSFVYQGSQEEVLKNINFVLEKGSITALMGHSGAIEAYTFINKLASEYQFITSDITSDTAKSNFQNGVTAFYIGGPWDIDGLNSAGTPFAVAPMPQLNGKNFVTPVGTQVGFVSSKSDSQEVVWEFYKYLLENSAEDLYTAGGRIPAQIAAQETIEKDEITESFITQISYGEPLPTASEMG